MFLKPPIAAYTNNFKIRILRKCGGLQISSWSLIKINYYIIWKWLKWSGLITLSALKPVLVALKPKLDMKFDQEIWPKSQRGFVFRLCVRPSEGQKKYPDAIYVFWTHRLHRDIGEIICTCLSDGKETLKKVNKNQTHRFLRIKLRELEFYGTDKTFDFRQLGLFGPNCLKSERLDFSHSGIWY